MYKAGWIRFKDFILNICFLCNDELSRNVRFRVNSAISDLHAADARYHQDWKTLFLHPKDVEQLASKASEPLEVDIGLESVKKALRKSQKELWNSVDLCSMSSESGGFKYSRRTLIKVLVDYFGDEVVLLSCTGLANILVFKSIAILPYKEQMKVMKRI